jgi:hypothetical protein
VPLGDDHGGEAVIGRRDTDWARGNSAVTNILLLSAVWVVGAVFANRNAPALGRILNQQGVGNSTFNNGSDLVSVLGPWAANLRTRRQARLGARLSS